MYTVKEKFSAWVVSHRAWAHTLAVSAGGCFVSFAGDADLRKQVIAQLAAHPRISAALTTAATWYLIYLRARR